MSLQQQESYIITVSHMQVLTLMTPASSRISFISPSSVGKVMGYCHSLFRHKATDKTNYRIPLTFLFHVLLVVLSDDQPPV